MGFCHSPFLGKTPSSVKSTIKFNTCSRTNETKTTRRSPYTAGRNLFNGEGYPLHCDEAQRLAAAETNQENFAIPVYGDILSESNPVLPDELSYVEEEVTMDKCVDAISLSPLNKKIKALESPHREALSHINSNTENSHFVPSDPKTPKMLYSIPGDKENDFQVLDTPLDKFTARSSRLKSSLVQEYIEFLNIASREELMELKGIGEKIAEYIVELRETSPLKSLGDLEKIGLSSKQVQNMFGRAARGLLANLIHNN